jgi:hypothetical protein
MNRKGVLGLLVCLGLVFSASAQRIFSNPKLFPRHATLVDFETIQGHTISEWTHAQPVGNEEWLSQGVLIQIGIWPDRNGGGALYMRRHWIAPGVELARPASRVLTTNLRNYQFLINFVVQASGTNFNLGRVRKVGLWVLSGQTPGGPGSGPLPNRVSFFDETGTSIAEVLVTNPVQFVALRYTPGISAIKVVDPYGYPKIDDLRFTTVLTTNHILGLRDLKE